MSKKAGLLNVGFGNIIPMSEVVAILNPSSAPVKRLIQKAKSENTPSSPKEDDYVDVKEKGLIDLTNGRKSRSVIITNYGRLYLSSLQPETIAARTNPVKFDLIKQKKKNVAK